MNKKADANYRIGPIMIYFLFLLLLPSLRDLAC